MFLYRFVWQYSLTIILPSLVLSIVGSISMLYPLTPAVQIINDELISRPSLRNRVRSSTLSTSELWKILIPLSFKISSVLFLTLISHPGNIVEVASIMFTLILLLFGEAIIISAKALPRLIPVAPAPTITILCFFFSSLIIFEI